MPITLSPDVIVNVEPPSIPVLQIAAPTSPDVVLVPVVGPAGPQGPPGAAGVSSNASFVWQQQSTVYLVQIVHNMGFYPAGVTAIDTAGDNIEYASVTYPSVNIVEVAFDLLFTGTIYLS